MRLREFLIKRTIHTIITLFVIVILLFVIFRLMPGDPTSLTIEPRMTEQQKQMRKHQLGLDQSKWTQFKIYIQGIFLGPFDPSGVGWGNSFQSGRPVTTELATRIPATLLLFGSALILSFILGVFFGAVLAWRRGSAFELSTTVVSLFFSCMPVFWVGIIMLWLFAYKFPIFPLGGYMSYEKEYIGLAHIGDVLKHLILPLFTLALNHFAGWGLLMRNSMLEVIGEDYIVTAKAKGCSERQVLYKHAARNAMLPVTTSLAMSAGGVIAGGVLTETIFSWPGVGYYLIQSTFKYDYPALQGAFFLLALLTLIANFCADILYAYLDPRVRL